MNIDPPATLRAWRVEVDIGPEVYTIPALPAAEWLTAILTGRWVDIVPGLIPGGDAVLDAVLDGAVEYEELGRVARDALSVAAGMKWWVAAGLAHLATGTWVAGELALHGVDPERLPLGAYLAAAHRAATMNMDEKDRGLFQRTLDRPPAGVPAEEWYDPEEAERAFMGLMAQQG